MNSNRDTIAAHVLPAQTAVRDVSLVVGGATLTAVCAQVQIPWQPVPFTLQTLAVMLCGLGMGRRLGVASQALYVTAGAAGLPIFAGAAGGWAKLGGPTGGYLVSFVLVAGLLGWLGEKGWTNSLWKAMLAFAAGIAINLGLGTLWLAAFVGFKAAFLGGCAPFIGIECLKAAVAIPAVVSVDSLLRRKG